MPLTTTSPSAEPVTLDEAKEHLKVIGSHEDALITRYIIAARAWVENFTGRALIERTLTLTLDGFGVREIELPMPPLSSVTSIAYVDNNGDSQTWSSALYTVVAPSGDSPDFGFVRPVYNEVYPTTRDDVETVTITYVAGYGTAVSDIPQGLKHGLLERLDDLYRNRDAGDDVFERLLSPYVVRHEDLRYR